MTNSQTEASPFIIWTLRRTGGTNLGDALFNRSTFESVEHEPFNADRVFGEVTRAWLANQNESALRAALVEICRRKVLIKHCLEVIPSAMNQVLAEVSTQMGYRHLFLYRRRPLDRLLSLHFAQRSGVWGKGQVEKILIRDEIFQEHLPISGLVDHEKFCRNEMREIFELLCKIGSNPLVLTFEDLYVSGDLTVAQHQLGTVLSALGLSQNEADDSDFFQRVLSRGEQGTRNQYRHFVDYKELANALGQLGEFELQKTSRCFISYPEELPPDVVKCEVWDLKPDVLANRSVISGVVVVAHDGPTGSRLLIEDTHSEREVLWSLPSPRMTTMFTANPKASHARFQIGGINVDAEQPIRLILEYLDGKRFLLAIIHY